MSLVNISLVVKFLENLLNLFLMIFICCTNEFVIRCIHQIPDSFDFCWYIIYEFLWCDSSLLGFELDLLSVLICSCLEEYIISLASLVTCDCICKHDLVCVSDMRFTWCIGNRCCYIIFWFFWHFCASFSHNVGFFSQLSVITNTIFSGFSGTSLAERF